MTRVILDGRARCHSRQSTGLPSRPGARDRQARPIAPGPLALGRRRRLDRPASRVQLARTRHVAQAASAAETDSVPARKTR